MFGFFLKKSFYDGWDNLFVVACFNGAVLVIEASALWLTTISGAARIAGLIVLAFGTSLWWSIAAHTFSRVADFKTIGFADIRRAMADGLLPGLQFGVAAAAATGLAAVAIPFYASLQGLVGIFVAGLVFWIFIAFWLTFQYVLPVRAATGGRFRDALRLSFVLFMDAPLFSIALAVYSLLCVVLSPLVAFLLPGQAQAVLAACEAVRLRRYKIRWLAESTGKPVGPVPWKELLADDMETLGDRRLKDLIFPWKH